MSNTPTKLSYPDSKTKALALIKTFQSNQRGASTHYPNIQASRLAISLTDTVNGINRTINQGRASLCGPAAFFFVLVSTRPDLYVQAATELFLTGKSQIGDLKLESSSEARQQNPSSLSGLDWMLLTSVKPKYDNVKEQFDGITLPGKLKRWLTKSGFSAVETHTSKVFTKGLKTLLGAQTDRAAGYSICLFVDADIFLPTSSKGKSALFPNHWVVLNSDIQIVEYDSANKGFKSAVVLTEAVLNKLKAADDEVRENSRIMMDVFTWGIRHMAAVSKASPGQSPKVDYFMSGFHGYIKAKR